jgi:uncharacterized protein (TIRG00374 family)
MNHYRFLTYSVVLTILVFGTWIAFEDHQRIFTSIRQVGWQGFLFICLFSLANYSLRYVRWVVLLRHLGDRFPVVDGLVCYVSGFALTTTPGKAGEAIRSLYFQRRHQVPHAHTLAALLSERASDALASLLIGSIAVYTFGNLRWLGFGFTLVVIAIVLLVNNPAALLRLGNLMRVIKLAWVQKILDMVPLFLARAADLLSVRMLCLGTAIALVSWSAEAYGFAWLAHQLGGNSPTLLYMSIFAIAMVAGAATFMPGGLGGTEAVMYLLLKLTGVGETEAVTATLLCRLATLWFAIVLGLAALLWLEANPEDLSSKSVGL